VIDAARLALGTAGWGMRYGVANRTGQPSSDEVAAMGRIAWEAGVRTLDTARAYGSSEEVVGALPEPWRVVTKLAPDVAGATIPAELAEERATASLAASRQALGRKRLDAVLLHRAAHLEESGGGAWRVLVGERESGRVGAIGASVTEVGQAWQLLEAPDVEVVQVPASLLDQRLARAGFFEAAERAGRMIVVRSIFLQGVAHLPADALPGHLAPVAELLRSADAVAAEAGVTRAGLFLGWARHRLGAATILVGCETREQLAANLDAWRAPGVEAAVARIEDRVPDLPDAILDPWRWPPA
jgi:aryl-alcohol dehydrogenase-like predicted oxidoreductase